MTSAQELIDTLGLEPHPEGGWFVETWKADGEPGTRAAGTAIYFVLRASERSHWHTVDADEIWLFHGGSPLTLTTSDGADIVDHELGADVVAGQRPQHVVPAGLWQSATSTGEWSLVSCIVVPGFDYAGFELAPPGWEPVWD
jgi:predicted cupin superfamily sugar epimerase